MPATGDHIIKHKDSRFMARYTAYTPDGTKRKTIYRRGQVMGKRDNGGREPAPLDANQIGHLLEAASRDRYEALYVLCLYTGLRQGEALGLRWNDVDLDAGLLHVERQLVQREEEEGEPPTFIISEPKIGARRAVRIPQNIVKALRRHHERQLEERFNARERWQEMDLVFTSETGGPVDARIIIEEHFKPLLERAGLPPIRFYDLRLTYAASLGKRSLEEGK